MMPHIQNHREHELRWAQGSFLQVIRKHVKVLNSSTLKMPWHIWLAMNPESDATAIWLERKFDVPESGSWTNESVFSIPLSSASGTVGYPGVIVFECTPLGDVADDLEKCVSRIKLNSFLCLTRWLMQEISYPGRLLATTGDH